MRITGIKMTSALLEGILLLYYITVWSTAGY